MKQPGKIASDEVRQIGRRLKAVGLANGDKPLVLHLIVVASPAASPAMAWVAPLFDIDQRHFQGQVLVGKGTREMDQIVE